MTTTMRCLMRLRGHLGCRQHRRHRRCFDNGDSSRTATASLTTLTATASSTTLTTTASLTTHTCPTSRALIPRYDNHPPMQTNLVSFHWDMTVGLEYRTPLGFKWWGSVLFSNGVWFSNGWHKGHHYVGFLIGLDHWKTKLLDSLDHFICEEKLCL